MDVLDAYGILEVHPNATPEQIRTAYLELVRVWHPDRFQGDPALLRRAEERQKQLNEAYAAIKQAPLLRRRGTTPAEVNPPREPPAATRTAPAASQPSSPPTARRVRHGHAAIDYRAALFWAVATALLLPRSGLIALSTRPGRASVGDVLAAVIDIAIAAGLNAVLFGWLTTLLMRWVHPVLAAVLTLPAVAVFAILVGFAAGLWQGAQAPSRQPPTSSMPDLPPLAQSPAADTTTTEGFRSPSAIRGRIMYDGPVPQPQYVKTGPFPTCRAMHPQGLTKQAVEAKGGGLASVFVYLSGGVTGTFPPPSEAIVLHQTGCMYAPHILGIQVGQLLTIRNHDDTSHTTHPRPVANDEFSIRTDAGESATWVFQQPEVMIPIGCDVHPWMRAFIAVLPHPFFDVSGEDGTFAIKGMAPGRYQLTAVHERLRVLTGEVVVPVGEAVQVEWTYHASGG